MWERQMQAGFVMKFPVIIIAEQLSRCGYAVHLSVKLIGEKYCIKKFFSATIKTDEDSGQIQMLYTTENEKTENDPQWYVPHHPGINPNKLERVRRVRNATSEFEKHSFNRSLLILLSAKSQWHHFLIPRRGFFGITTDIKAMSLQVKVPAEDAKCLRIRGESISLTTYQPISILVIYLRPKNLQRFPFMHYIT